jgi:molybdopterin/thiamine biosynthesis adenylyltransferase
MKKTDRISKRMMGGLLSELWENATFSKESFDIVSRLAVGAESEDLEREFPLEEIYYELTTLRNRYLIRTEQQKLLRETVVGMFGMSVGSHAAITWMMESRADVIKIVDLDTVAATNLNRLKFRWSDVGKKKVDVVKRQILEMNPHADVFTFNAGDEKDMDNVFNAKPKIDIVVDEVDNIDAKVRIRKFARNNRIPLLQAADVGDNVVLDVERYDLKPQPEMFLGRIPEIERVDLTQLSEKERIRLIVRTVGFEANSESLLESLLEIGETLATWPQLGATATISGGVITTAIKKIVLGEEIESGKYYINLDNILVRDFNIPKRERLRIGMIKRTKKKLGIIDKSKGL